MFERVEVSCKLCTRNVNDIVHHFILDCPVLYRSRGHLMDKIVNSLPIETYVKFTYKSENVMINTILGSREYEVIPEEEWSDFILSASEGITTMLKDMRIFL